MKTFHLSEKDCDALRDRMDAEQNKLAYSADPGRWSAWEEAKRLLHASQMEAFRARSKKRRQPLDLRACKDA